MKKRIRNWIGATQCFFSRHQLTPRRYGSKIRYQCDRCLNPNAWTARELLHSIKTRVALRWNALLSAIPRGGKANAGDDELPF